MKLLKIILPFLLFTLLSNTTFSTVSHKEKESKEISYSAQKLGIKPKNLTNAYKEVGKVSNGVKKQAIERASKFRGNWGKGNLNESIERLVGKNPNISTTPSGKIIYKGDNGVQVVHDYHGKYFRVENTSLVGKRRYLDLDGNVPNNKVLPDGRIVGSSKSEYEAATHFSME